MENKFRDSLTGIFNEDYLKKNYQSYLDKHPDSNFIMIDFEKFKSINDTFGQSGKAQDLLEYYGLTKDSIIEKIM